jgi:hypothetical protein
MDLKRRRRHPFMRFAHVRHAVRQCIARRRLSCGNHAPASLSACRAAQNSGIVITGILRGLCARPDYPETRIYAEIPSKMAGIRREMRYQPICGQSIQNCLLEYLALLAAQRRRQEKQPNAAQAACAPMPVSARGSRFRTRTRAFRTAEEPNTEH